MNDRDTPLSPDQLSDLREELLRALSRLDRSLKTMQRTSKPVVLDQTSVGRLSRIDAMQNQGITRELQARDGARRAQIEEALRRLRAGEYGQCTGCGESIPYERLLVFPETMTCGRCGGGG